MDRVTQFREAIKVALAMTIAYYLPLRFAWMSPTWPAIAVAMISLPTAGQSINKGMLRITGTLFAFAAGLFFLGLFPQARWGIFLAFTPFLAYVVYRMTGTDGQYFWFCAAFVSLMIIKAGPGDGDAFVFAAYRTMETIAGVVIWTVIAVFVWPRSNRKTLIGVSCGLCDALAQLVGVYREVMLDSSKGDELKDVRAQAGKLAGQLEQTIGAAASESYEVREVRHLWMRLNKSCAMMLNVLDRMTPGLRDLQDIDIQGVVGDLKNFFPVLEDRLRDAGNILGGKPPGVLSETKLPSFNTSDLERMNPFQRAAVEVTRDALIQLDETTLAIGACVRELEGYETREADAADTTVGTGAPPSPAGLSMLDPDRIRSTIMVVVSMWSGILIWIYVNPPGHAAWFQFVPTLALIAAQVPHVQFKLFKPMAYSYTVTLVVYIFLMPKLSTFWALGSLIFGITFIAAYFFTGVARIAIYLSMFNMLGISNQQTYNFAAQANALVFTLLGIMLVVVLTYITRSPRPEKAFLSMLSRFFHSCEFLVSRVADPARKDSYWQRMQRAFYLAEIRSLPKKLGMWGTRIDGKKFPNNTAAQVQGVVQNAQVLAYRIEELLNAAHQPQADLILVELGEDVKSWLRALEQGLCAWAERPEAESPEILRKRLSARLAHLDSRIEETLKRAAREDITDEQSRRFYRLLGGFRGLSEAAIAYAGVAGTIDWREWREERF